MSNPFPSDDPAGYLASSPLEQTEGMDNTGTKDAIPAPPADDRPIEERDAYWRKHVYLGDSQLQLTIRAVLIGGVLGGLMSITGLFITLKTGWGLGLTIIATLGSYSVMNALTRLTKGSIRPFTMLENNCMTSTAVAASSSTGMTIVGCFGGLLLVSPTNVSNPPMLAMGAVVFFTALLGICLAIPLKRRMVNDENLAFPSPRAGAEMLRSLYADGRDGLIKARALFAALGIGALVGLSRALPLLSETFGNSRALAFLAKYAAIPEDIAIPAKPVADAKLAGMAFEPSLLLTAVGLIVGMRVSLSMFFGSCLLYFVLAPAMHDADTAWLTAHAGTEAATGFKAAMEVKAGMIKPGSWGLWGGTALLISSSFVSLALQWRTLAKSFSVLFSKGAAKTDPVADLEVPMSWAIIGGIPCAIGLMISLWLGFGVNPFLGVVALLISCLVAVVCARTAAETDINPIGSMGKVTQLAYAVLPGSAGSAAINLVAAGSTSAAGGSAVDMLCDLKSSHMLGANPRKVWLAQFAGVFFGIICVVPAWYKIVPNKETLETKFNAIPAQMWSAVAKFLTDKHAQFYHGAVTLMIVCAVIGTLIPLVAHFAPKTRKWMPSALGLGLALSLPFSNCLSFMIGALIMFVWEKGWKKSAAFFGLVIASGLMSGEAIVSSVTLLGTQIVHGLAK
jgi:uncharacterized oligopeptide transporter (OPT) family protein